MNETTTTERQPYVSNPTAPLDAISGASHFLRNNWGDYGYSMSIEANYAGRYLFGCRCGDGSEFFIMSDHYGNATEVVLLDGKWTGKG